ncbi:MAG: hypothetical protein AAFU85_03450 [Planctomycetota bacterium]
MQFFEYDLDAILADAQASETGRACWGEEKGHLWLASLLRSHTQAFVKCRSIDSAIPQSHAATRFNLCAIRISNFLRFDVLPTRKLYKEEPWSSMAFRCLFQTSLAVYLGRLGNQDAIDRVAESITESQQRVRQACLVLLSTRLFEDGDPLPASWVDGLRSVLNDSSVSIRLVSLITRLHGIEDMVPKLLAARNRLEQEEQLRVILDSILVSSDGERRQELFEEALPRLDAKASRKWFAEFAASARNHDQPFGRDLAASVLEQLISRSSPMDFARFLATREARRYYLSHARVEHLPVLKSISEDTTIAAQFRSAGVGMFAKLNPERDLDAIFEYCERDFDVFAEAIGDVRDDAETESAIRLARVAFERALRPSSFRQGDDAQTALGPASVRLLWSCGDSGRELLFESMQGLDLAAIQSLTWLAEGITIATAVARARELGLATTAPVALRLKLQKKGGYLGPRVVFHLMEFCERSASLNWDLPVTTPTRYVELLKTLASGTAGQLASMSASIAPCPDGDPGWNLSLRRDEIETSFGVSCIDAFADSHPVRVMNEFAARCGLEGRFREVEGGVFWGPPDSVEELIDIACIAGNRTAQALIRCRESCIARIKRTTSVFAVADASV